MQHRNFRLDFYTPFFSADKESDPYRMAAPQKLTSSVDFYENYHKADAKSKFMKRELGLPLLFENEELLRPVKAKNQRSREQREPVEKSSASNNLQGNTLSSGQRIIKPNIIHDIDSSRVLNLPYIKTFGINAQNYRIIDDLVKTSYVEKNKKDIVKLQKSKQVRQKYHSHNPGGKVLDNFLKFQQEFYFENPDMKEWAKEANIEEEIEDVKKIRMKKQINRIFFDAGLNEREKQIIFKQLLFEFHPDKYFHDREFSYDIFNYLQDNKVKFLDEDK